MRSLLLCVLGVGFALAAPAAAPAQENIPLQCPPQTLKVDSQWTMAPTTFAANQNCMFTFEIPSDSYAIVEVNANDIGYLDDVYISDQYGDTIGKMTKDNNWSTSLAWPGTVKVVMYIHAESTPQIGINIIVKKAASLENVVARVPTSSNSQSTVLYLSDWVEGTSYVFTSQSSKINIKVADNSLSGDEESLYTNVFVYDGDQVVGTLYQMYQSQDFISKTNKVTLYMAKKTIFRAAVIVTDQSNIQNLEAHYVTYAPYEQPGGVQTHLISGDTVKEGALTIIGDKDGSTPIDILLLNNLDDLNGSFSVASGGPLASHSQATQLTNAALPVHLSSNVNTIYLSRGSGTVKYSTTGK